MRVQSSFAFLVLPLAGALALTGCPGPDVPSWTSESCYCDDTGYCADYDGNVCTVGSASSSGSFGGSGGASSSGFGGTTSSGGTSGASSTSSSGFGGTTSSGGSGGTTSSGGSSGASSGDIDGGGASSGGSSGEVDAGPAPNCSSDAQCGSNQTCSGGFCRFECTTADECKLYDSRLDVCDQGVCKSE